MLEIGQGQAVEELLDRGDSLRAIPARPLYPQFARPLHTACSIALALEYLLENQVITVQCSVACAQARDGAAGMQHGGVIAIAESFADFGQAHLGKVLG